MKISIVIPNYNGATLLPACLKSLPRDQEIIIVDNGSTDGSVSKIKKLKNSLKIRNLKLKINSRNLGFAAAVNQGILAASNDYVVLINNDIVLHPQWFQNISQTIAKNQDPRIVVFSGLVLTRDGTYIESEGLQYFWRGKCQNISNGRPFHKSYIINHKSKFVWGANAACTVYHRQTLINIGLFDENFFAYEEDVDLCLRLQNLGYHTLYVPTAISYHLGGATSSRMGNFRQRMDAKNWIYVIIKNYSLKQVIFNLPGLIIERLRNLSGLIKNTPILQILPSLLSVYVTILINIPKMVHKRRQIAKLLYDYRH